MWKLCIVPEHPHKNGVFNMDVHSIDVILLGLGTTMEGFNGVGIRWDVAKKAKPWVLVPGPDQFAGGRLDRHSLRPAS